MWKLATFFFRLNFLRGLAFTGLCAVACAIAMKVVPGEGERLAFVGAILLASSLVFPAFFGISGVSSQLAWIHALPLKRRSVFLLDYATRLVSLVQMAIFHLVPLTAFCFYLDPRSSLLAESRGLLASARALDLHAIGTNFSRLEPTPLRLSFAFGGLALLHILALTSTTSFAGSQATLDRNRMIRAKGFVRYFLDLDFIRKAQVFSVVLLGGPIFLQYFVPNSPFLLFAVILQGILVTGFCANIRKFKLPERTNRGLFAGHLAAAVLFIAGPAGLAYTQVRGGTTAQRVHSIQFLGELAPKLDSRALVGLVTGSREGVSIAELKEALQYQGANRPILSFERDWPTFLSLVKSVKSARGIELVRSLFAARGLTENQVIAMLTEYARVRKGAPTSEDYLSLTQYAQPVETVRKFVNSNFKELNRFGLYLTAFTLENRVANDIRNSVGHYDPFDQRFAISVLSVLEGRPLGVTDWKPQTTVVVLPGKGKEKGREIASVAAEPRDLRRMCETLALPDFAREVSREQLNDLSSCVRFRSRGLDLATRAQVDALRWFETAPEAGEVALLRQVFSIEARAGSITGG